MKWVLRFFSLAMIVGGIFMGYYAGTELETVTNSFQWELAVAWWFIGLVAGALFFTLEMVLSHLKPAENPNTEKTKRNMEKNKINIKDKLIIKKNKLDIDKNKVYPASFGPKKIGFTKREPPETKTM